MWGISKHRGRGYRKQIKTHEVKYKRFLICTRQNNVQNCRHILPLTKRQTYRQDIKQENDANWPFIWEWVSRFLLRGARVWKIDKTHFVRTGRITLSLSAVEADISSYSIMEDISAWHVTSRREHWNQPGESFGGDIEFSKLRNPSYFELHRTHTDSLNNHRERTSCTDGIGW